MREVDALITELDRIGAAAILSVTATGNRLPDGTDIREVATRVAGSPAIVSIGVNCCSGDTALAAIRALRSVTTLPLIAYPNSGESWDRVARQWHAADSVTNPVAAAPKLLQAGAQLIGGCCRVSPSDIQQIAALLRPAAKPLS
jgi:homocysteine S-methyltransferase